MSRTVTRFSQNTTDKQHKSTLFNHVVTPLFMAPVFLQGCASFKIIFVETTSKAQKNSKMSSLVEITIRRLEKSILI